jgi:flagellar biosynthesis/type III secretory pathway protein FliH
MIIRKRHQQDEIKNGVEKKSAHVDTPKKPAPKAETEHDVIKKFESVDITNIEFKERLERRRGDRRRGYRRIDERTLVSRAQEEARSIRELAAKEGYKNGLEKAKVDIENLKTALSDFLGMKDDVYDYVSKDILEIAVEVAKKIIKKEVELSQDVLKGILEEVLEQVNIEEQKITIKVSPEELEFAKASIPEILANSHFEAKILIIPDADVEKGSCTLLTSNGVVDANFSTQLQVIQNAFGIYKGSGED